jgi:hypothetical protein
MERILCKLNVSTIQLFLEDYIICVIHYCSGINGVCLGGCATDPTGDVHSCHMCVI